MCNFIKKAFVISIIFITSFLFSGCASGSSSQEDIELTQAAYSPEETNLETSEISPKEETESSTTTVTTTTYNVSGKICINENEKLSKESAENLVVRLIREYYTSSTPENANVNPDAYIIDFSASIRNESVKSNLMYYLSNSDSPVYYESMSDYGTYYSVSGLTEKDSVLFEMDNNRFAISEPYSDITDYSMRYPYLFTIRNSDSTTAYYWCAQQETDLICYASHRVVRIWIYNSEKNTYSCIYDKE